MLPSISPSIRPSTSPHCFALNISLPQRAQVLSITSAHTNTYSMCTTRTLKYRVSSVPNCRKGDGGSEISQQHGAVHAHLCVCVCPSNSWWVGVCLLPAGEQLWCYDFSVSGLRGLKKLWKLQYSLLISLESASLIFWNSNWNYLNELLETLVLGDQKNSLRCDYCSGLKLHQLVAATKP